MKRTYKEPPPLPRVMRYGHQGDDVRQVQTILRREGFFHGTPLGNYLRLTTDAVSYFQGTHIGRDGEHLEADGKVGRETWWALHNPHGSAQKNYIPAETGVGLAATTGRAKLVRFMYELHKVGVREVPNGSNYGDGVTPIVNACGFRYGIAWCMAQVSHAFKEALGRAPLSAMHVGCSAFWNEAVKQGCAHSKVGYTPIPGDIAIYNYRNGLRHDGRLVGSGHATVVVRVAHDGKSHNAIEGNAGNRCKHSIRKESEKTLVGYVNLFNDADNPPHFPRGITAAPVVELTLADSR